MASSVARGGLPAAVCCARTCARGWCGGAGVPRLPPAAPSSLARAMDLPGRGGPAPRWRARSLEAGLLRLRAEHARTSACGEVGWWWISLLPGAPCAMRARSGRGRHARGRQERRAPPSRTPPRSRTSRSYRALCARTTGHGARARCSSRPRDRRFPPVPSTVAPLQRGPIAHKSSWLSSRTTFTTTSVRAWTRPRTHKWSQLFKALTPLQ